MCSGVIISLNPTSVKRWGDLVYLTTERSPKVNFSYHFWMRPQVITNGIRVQPSLLWMWDARAMVIYDDFLPMRERSAGPLCTG